MNVVVTGVLNIVQSQSTMWQNDAIHVYKAVHADIFIVRLI